ncbi:MAG: dihydrolipoyl dehydrogenase [Burkholderiales bacterium]|nr:dihydrolipoyl dehydrogenase [Burkholderiales bacterium]OUT80024.1 MAG: dihydrolipoyl dehydrogenase [Betaproteobacteria bacterium TMED22]|tara:strand:- start:998 stop:2764 length:1767 start_codon:yes stop_codon:yes gene_type:complete
MPVIKVNVPDVGDFKDIPVIEVLVKPGDQVQKEDSLLTLESDKATMDVPSPLKGTVKEVHVEMNDRVSEGRLIFSIETENEQLAERSSEINQTLSNLSEDDISTPDVTISSENVAISSDLHAEVVVLGSGPGGYTAAFRAADLGKKVVLIEQHSTLGGVCLNVGCIPSKALLHAAKVIEESKEMGEFGISFGKPKIDLDQLRNWKDGVIGKLTKGLTGLAKQRKVETIQGKGRFIGPNNIEVQTSEGPKRVSFNTAIIAAGSQVTKIPDIPYEDPRVMDSTDALTLRNIPKSMLVIGGGIIGLEMATVYRALGTKITVVEMADSLIPGADKDIVRPLHKRLQKQCEGIHLKTKVKSLTAEKNGLKAQFEGNDTPKVTCYEKVLVAVGRKPNGKLIGAESAGINVDDSGFIPVNKQMQTSVPHIYAIGDIVGNPMLAHKATHEGKLAAEIISGHKASFDAKTIPSVAYTDPEIAWMGITETEAKAEGIEYEKATFPWAASGRSLAMGRDEGITKLLFDKNTSRLIGAAIVGSNAGELIGETVLALEMGADAQDIGLTIHPHPTLSESVFLAAEIAEGSITDLFMPKKKT